MHGKALIDAKMTRLTFLKIAFNNLNVVVISNQFKSKYDIEKDDSDLLNLTKGVLL